MIQADKETDVIKALEDADLWSEQKYWRFYGDYENNYNTIGNQQSQPEAALVEKIINSVDARLMNECQMLSINPEGKKAPKSIREAVARFFDKDANPNNPTAGLITNGLILYEQKLLGV